ncbi:MAG: hypothetical protein LBH81_03290 [Rickettsiales bacterium]|jgi:hypothetical protein|nr:hypothetical protein [Rickettsiales bacterium]
MKDNMNAKEWADFKFQKKMDKLRAKRNVNFRIFVVNYIMMAAAWLFSMVPWYNEMVQYVMHMNADEAHFFILDLLGIMAVLNAAFFLAPAIGQWWEMSASKKPDME